MELYKRYKNPSNSLRVELDASKEIEQMLELNAKIQANIEFQTMLLQECLKIVREMKGDKHTEEIS